MHRQVLYLVRHLNKEVFEPVVCTQSNLGGLREEYKVTGCKLLDLKWKGRGSLAILYRLIKILYKEKPDIVFIAQPPNLIYYRLARIFWYKPTIQIGSFRALTFWFSNRKRFYQYIDNIFSKLLFLSSDYVVVNSIAMRTHYSQILRKKPNKTIEIIYNGSDFNFPVLKQDAEMRRELNITPDEIIIVMIARLDPWKDFTTLLEAAKNVVKADKRAKFLIVGDGELRNILGQMIIQMDLKSNVLLTGEKTDVFNYINLADISVLSTNGEGFSNSILESMALCKPVIATSVGGNAELLGSTNQCGLLIPPKSPGMFADAILYLMRNEVVRKDMGLAGKEKIYQLCSIEKYISSYEELFLRSLSKNKN